MQTDVDEIECLVEYLQREQSAEAISIVGHSTGCQDIVYFMKRAKPNVRLLTRLIVLQAPCSDREAATVDPDYDVIYPPLLNEARELIASGKGQHVFHMHYGFVPMSADRFYSLIAKGGTDDMFSSDFSDDELKSLLSHCSTSGEAL